MAFRIASQPVAQRAKTAKSKGYLAWLHGLPCVVSGQSPVEAAHVSYANQAFGASGRGKSQKASDRWALPLHPDLHREQHQNNEARWWVDRRVDPHAEALVLWGIWNEHKKDEAKATEVAERVMKMRRERPR